MNISKGLVLVLAATTALISCKKDDEEAAPLPQANFTYTPATCTTAGCTVTFTNTSANATAFTWNFGDNTPETTETSTTVAHTFAEPGYYTVKLTATGNGKTHTSEQMVAVGVCSYTPVQVTEDITGNTTWETCKLYIINNDISVNGTLTIEAGAIVKFKQGMRMTVANSGTLVANGSAAAPIIFTSYKDDASGGDTNGDGSASQPERNDWVSVTLSDAIGSSFKHCKFMYGGTEGVLELWEARATIQNCTFAHNGGGSPNFKGALNAKLAKSGTVIKDNIFYLNQMPLSISTALNIDNSNTFHNPDDAAQKNTHNGIWLNDGDEEQNITLAETEVPFVNNDFTIGLEHTLTLAAGVIVKNTAGSGYQLNGDGNIQANGTAGNPVIFTSYLDDANGGDTNADGASTQPAPQNWTQINVNGTNGSVFNHCKFMYGGDAAGSAATLNLSAGSQATITNSVFAHNFGGGNVEYSAALDASMGETGTVIKNNVFYGNVRPLSISSAFDLDNSNVFHNPANTSQRNTFDAIVTAWGNTTVKNNLKWEENEVAFTTFYDIAVPIGKTLEVGEGVVIKFNSATQMTLAGVDRLVGGNRPGVVFTSEKDDSVGGDSDGNGSATSPTAGDWEGIYIDSSPGVWLDWSNIRYDNH